MGSSIVEGARANSVSASVSKFYASDAWVETRAEDQARSVAGWPGMQAVACFPDLHPGVYGPVGSAFLADRLYPQLVGGDVGCGMAVFQLDLSARKLKLDKAAKRLRTLGDSYDPFEDLPENYDGETTSLGTIGGGNHFCELQEVVESHDPTLPKGTLMLMVHSGSRGYGAGLFRSIKERWAEGFLPDSPEAQDYIAMHDAAMRYAFLNRTLIAKRAAVALRCNINGIVDAPHNFVEPYQGAWLHRKGAAASNAGALIPLAGSRDSLSYLLKALTPPENSLASTAHGAGRKYDRASMHGRVQSGRKSRTAMERNAFGGHVICEDRDLIVEEAGQAYKSAERVVRDLQAARIAAPMVTLSPLITFKKTREEL